jgi:hypothetical protein
LKNGECFDRTNWRGSYSVNFSFEDIFFLSFRNG